jgi:DNA-binding transcriptional MocR family regulator
MHLIAQAGTRSEQAITAAAIQAKVAYHPVSWFSRSSVARGLILGYAAYTPEASRKAIQNWARALNRPQQSAPTQ